MSKDFFKKIRIYQTNVRLILMFLHTNHITILLHNHIFKVKFLTQDTNSLHMIIEKDVISLLTIVLDLSPQTIISLLFVIDIIQNITRDLLQLHNKTQPMLFENPQDHLFRFL